MNQFDKIFRNKLEHHTVDVPAGSWENIASRLPQQKKQLRPLVPIMFISFGILVLVGVLLLSRYASPNVANNQNLNSNNQDKSSFAENSNTKVNKNVETSSINQTESLTSNISNTLSSNNVQTTSSKSSLNPNADRNFDLSNDASSVIGSLDDLSGDVNVVSVQDLAIDSDPSMISMAYRAPVHVEAISNKLKNTKFPVQRRIKYAVPFRQNSKPAKACPFTFDAQDKSIDIYFSHDYASKTLQPNGGESQGYLDMRNQTEKSMYSYSFGARFGYNLSYRWNLHTGFNYSQINEKFEYTDPESNQTRLITIKDYVYENGKIVDSIITEETVVVPGTEKLKVFNKFRSFDIPVIARITLLANRHLSLSATAGVYVNLGFSQRGMMLGENSNTPIEFTSGKENAEVIYKTQLGLSVYSGISLAYHLTSNIDFVLEPHVRLQTESMTVGDYALKQNFNTFGVATGLRYKF
jgi:hypothetical protein